MGHGLRRGRGHLGAVALHDPDLGAGRVVLVELADTLEQRGAARVVEVLAGEALWRLRQPLEPVAEQLGALGSEVVQIDARRGGVAHEPLREAWECTAAA